MWPANVQKALTRVLPRKVQSYAVVLAIPLAATVIAARQHILNRTQDLSVWKGGGMGMFAAEEKVNRYTKVYIVTPDGNRHPVVQLTEHQYELLSALQNNPSNKNFLRLAENIRRTWWVSSKGKFPFRIVDKNGKLVSVQPGKHLYLRAGSPRVEDYKLDWKLVIEFWKGTYDLASQLVRVNLVKTFTYPQE